MTSPRFPIPLALAALALCEGALAQSTFMRTYNKGNIGFAVREVNGNGYVAAGGTDYFFNWHWNQQSTVATTNVHLFKTDQNGTLLWERILGLANNRTIARWMETTADGGSIIAGISNKDRVWPPDSNDVLVIKTDDLGTITWSKSFDTGKDDLGFCVRQTSDGGYIVSGFHDPLPITLAGSTCALLIKLDALGAVVWAKKYPIACRDLNTHEPFPSVVNQTADGGYVVTGSTVGAHPNDVYVLRTDANGGLLWAKSYEHDPSAFRTSTGQDILETAAGDLIIAGSMDKTQPNERNYPYVLRTDANGALEDATFYETNPLLFFQSGFSSVAPTLSGGYFFTGMGGYSGFGDQAQLLKTDADLNMIWSRVYTMDGLATMGARSGRPTSDGGYIFTGKHQFAGTVLMKTDAQGMVPCKNPNVLIEYTPDLVVLDHFPIPTTGISATDVLFTSTTPLVDTTTTCPLTQTSLPIELGPFSATVLPSEQVLTQWITFTENENAWFVVERSTDGEAFEEAGSLEGAGSSLNTLHYSFIDEHPLPAPVSYYRLVQVDENGASTASPMVAVAFEQKPLQLVRATGDRAAHVMTIEVIDDREEPLNYTVTDPLGRTVLQGSVVASRGWNRWNIDAPMLAPGVHALRIGNGSRVIAGKVAY